MPIKSMTGYGCGEVTVGNITYRTEIKTLNSRFCDVGVRLPYGFNVLEHKIISLAKERFIRGKVDVSVNIAGLMTLQKLPNFNQQAFKHYLALVKEAMLLAQAQGEILVSDITKIMRMDGVLDGGANTWDAAVHEEHIMNSVAAAIDGVAQSREVEGQQLHRAFIDLLQSINSDIAAITAVKQEIQNQLYDNLKKKVEQILLQLAGGGAQVAKAVPEERLLIELAVLTDKADITEELTRLGAHQKEFASLLDKGDDVGRKLDFLCQEMHREANTISSKVTNLRATGPVMNLKQGIERVRQQVQNIE